MIQPRVINGIVANENSSAPNKHAMATSLAVLIEPSVCNVTLSLKSFATKVL